MPSAPLKPCSIAGCPEMVKSGRCDHHRAQADRARGTATQRGYKGAGHHAFREAVLARQPVCRVCRVKPATEADHYPKSRRQLIELGLNPNDPRHGRGLCKPCHSSETAKHQPGGWNAER